MAHEFAYGAVGIAHAAMDQSIGHAHIGWLTAVLGPIAVLGLGRFGLAQVRRLRADSTGSVSPLPRAGTAALTLGGFVGLEVVEHIVSGAGALGAFSSPAVLLGMALCVPIAWVLATAIEVAIEAVAAVAASARQSTHHTFVWLPVVATEPLRRPALLDHVVARRGPPSLP